ncbi:alpha-2-macroglobulin [Halichoeres trimaculatus]|uniref:alpha-2-macroglobulin n=1 Tax=Halichoeres trimaculatus TaxID=147232 RepID=UPI003D9F824D
MAPVLQMLAVILAAGFLPAPTSTHDVLEVNYAVTVSSQLKGGSTEKLCVNIHQPSEPICITIKLEMPSGTKRTIIMEKRVKYNFFQCFTFKVPKVSSSKVANISVLIESQDDDTAPIAKTGKVLIVPDTFVHIVRTNQPIYKPGQNVMFRIVSMDTDFIPVKRVYKLVEIQDPDRNRIAQWLDEPIEDGILDHSHQLIPEAVEGTYTINAKTNKGEKITYSFKVEEFVLPKYEVQVQVPSVVTVFDKEAKIKICGKYTYGKPVNGSIQAVFCTKGYRYRYYRYPSNIINICRTYGLSTDGSGCATQVVNVAESFTSTNVITHFEVRAEMKEFGTGVTMTESGRINFSRNLRSVRFENAAITFKHGLPFVGKIKLIGPDNSPVPNENVTISAWYPQTLTVTTDSRGIAKFSLDTIRWRGFVSIRAYPRGLTGSYPSVPYTMRPRYNSGYHSVREFYSKSKNFVQLMLADEDLPCDRDATFYAQYIIQGKEVMEGQDSFKFYFLVTSRGESKHQGTVEGSVKHGIVNKGELSVIASDVVNLAPVAQVIIYTVLPSGEMVGDSMDYPVQLCFNNKVSLKFPQPQLLPAQKTKLNLKAEPGSLCSVRAIDLSVLLLEQQEALTANYIYGRLPVKKLSGYSYQVEDNEPYPCLPDGEPPVSLEAYGLSYIPQYYQRDDVYSSFKEIGIKIVTNMKIKRPRNCQVRLPTPSYYPGFWTTSFFRTTTTFPSTFPGTLAFPSRTTIPPTTSFLTTTIPQTQSLATTFRQPSGPEAKKEVIRKVFPETWIWDLVPVGDEGSTNLDKTVPDTITKWVAGAFCVSPVGFGVSPNVGLTAFKPFFISATLPFSVIRGESFRLRATVFSYLSKCIVVKAALAKSDQYTFKDILDHQYTVCLCGEESKTFSWIVTPTALGQVGLKVSAEAQTDLALCGSKASTVPEVGQKDTVIRKLLVEAEGTPQSVSHSALLCPAEKPAKEEISLVLPEKFVEGSVKASVSVVGDLMGQALKNIDNLLRMPYGCGEQNMLKFAPNIFVLNYLESTRQLTKEIKDRGKRFLLAGYQRELRYKHRDGSYSAFGESWYRYISGNTWLTAFVMKSFFGAQSYIYVENKHIEEAKRWLSSLQDADGCIRSVGRLFHNAMKGGVRDEVTLTAYVIAAMLEIDNDVTVAVVQNGLTCLKTALEGKVDNLYVKALMFYTFTLAKDEAMRLKLIQELHSNSTAEGGTRHWVRPGASKTRLDALEVEMTSYVLLALLSGPTLTGFELGYSVPIARWLFKQQNPYGGFSSTQDTVVALQALSKYASATFSEEGRTNVTVKSKETKKLSFFVNKRNNLLLQESTLSKVPGEYTVKAKGKRCVLVQISMTYNIPPPADFSTFNIIANTEAVCNASKPELTLSVQVSFQGPRDETNMVILDIKLQSGYTQNPGSLLQLENNPSVSHVEVAEGHVIVYLEELKVKQLKTFKLQMDKEESVTDLKPSVIRVYDYYQTSDEAATVYTSPCDNENASDGE